MGETHQRYTWQINRREGWQGHLWQRRFASFPMDEAHLHACVRYVELNPVRARLVERAEQWRWSSARAHLGLGTDGLTDLGPMRERITDWRGLLDSGLGDAERGSIRAGEKNGRPLGSPAFLDRLGVIVGRDLRPRRPGRPRKWGQPPISEATP